MPYWRTGGAMKFYRRKCFEQIGGIKPIYGWDGLDEYQAMYYGWKTRTFFELPVNHLGKKRAINREKQLWLAKAKGKSLYQRGYPIEFVVGRFLMLVLKSKLKTAICFLKEYLKLYFVKNNLQIVTNNEKKFIRKIQYLRIIDKFFKKELL